jgi:hypothetical protein
MKRLCPSSSINTGVSSLRGQADKQSKHNRWTIAMESKAFGAPDHQNISITPDSYSF